MALMQLDVPEDINNSLRKFVIDSKLKNREKATIYILKNFLDQFNKLKKNEQI